jgi:phosphomevalonate kinase
MDSFSHYVDALRQFDTDHDLGIFDAGHAELAEMAANCNIVYKPCGAGGGDIGVVFAVDEEAAIEFCEQAEQHNFAQLTIKQDAHGAEARIRNDIE